MTQETAHAEVVMLSGVEPDSRITAEELHRYQPSTEEVDHARARFKDLGFEVTHHGGVSFTISAAVEHFNEVFGVELKRQDHQHYVVERDGMTLGYELPKDQLDARLRDIVHAVTFAPPVDFGPTDYA
jgi:hypothetical protein